MGNPLSIIVLILTLTSSISSHLHNVEPRHLKLDTAVKRVLAKRVTSNEFLHKRAPPAGTTTPASTAKPTGGNPIAGLLSAATAGVGGLINGFTSEVGGLINPTISSTTSAPSSTSATSISTTAAPVTATTTAATITSSVIFNGLISTTLPIASKTSSSASSTATASSSNSSSGGLHGLALIGVIVGSSIVGIFLLWTLIRKIKLGTSKKFDKKLKPIDEFGQTDLSGIGAVPGGSRGREFEDDDEELYENGLPGRGRGRINEDRTQQPMMTEK